MNFVKYDPETFKSLCYGSMAERTLDDVIQAGEPVIRVTEWPDNFDLLYFDVDPTTKTLVPNSYIPPEEPPVPEQHNFSLAITDRQLFQQAALSGYIGQEEALRAVQGGYIPTRIQTVIDAIADPNEKFSAQMFFAGSTLFVLDGSNSGILQMAFQLTSDEMKSFFEAAVNL